MQISCLIRLPEVKRLWKSITAENSDTIVFFMKKVCLNFTNSSQNYLTDSVHKAF